MRTEELRLPTLLPWQAATRRGPRQVNADASAAHQDPRTGRWAFVVADGVGDHPLAANAAALAAQTAARVAATEGPQAAILAAQRALLAVAPDEHGGDCVLVVAVPDSGPSGQSCEVAWVGDCRAYQSNGRVWQQITTDHTVAEYFRSRRQPVTPRMEHLVTTSIRTVRPDQIGHSSTGFGAGRLVLCSDGVHKVLTTAELRDIVDRPVNQARTATELVARAVAVGGRDNATALVVGRAPRFDGGLAAAA